MKTKIIRKRLLDRGWLKYKLDVLVSESEKIHRFHQFNCDPFFVGEQRAKHNLVIWRMDKLRNDRKIKFIKSILNGTR